MQYLSQKFISQKFESQFQKYLKKFRLRYQLIQKIILLILLIFYIIEKVFQSSWFVVSLNIILACICFFSLKYQKKCIRVYEILMLIGILLFNIFYASAQYLQVHPERYQFIDGYFLAILSLTIINMMDTIQKAFILFFIYLIFLILIPNQIEPIWQQIVKFLIYIILYYQQQRYQQQLLRLTYLQYFKHLTIENSIRENLDMKYYLVNFIENQRSIMLQAPESSQYANDDEQIEFQKFLRKIYVTNLQSKIAKQIPSRKRSADLNLEQFLFYLFTDKQKLRQLDNYEQKYQDHQHHLFGFTMSESYIIKVIKCFDKDPCAILLVTEQQKQQFVDKLKLQNKATLKLLNYFSDIFNTQIRLPLIILNGMRKQRKQQNTNSSTQQKQQDSLYLNFITSQIYLAYNKYQNINDFFLANQDFRKLSLQKFDLIKTLENLLGKVKYFKQQNRILTKLLHINTKLEKLMIVSDMKQVSQLLLNLTLFAMQYSEEIYYEIEEDQLQTYPPQPIINIQIIFKCLKGTKIDLNKFPIVNPITLEEVKKNDKKPLDLYISIALLIIRNLGPFDKMTMRNVGKQFQKIQFFLYQNLNLDMHLIPIHSFDPQNYIKKDEEWQFVHSQKYHTSTFQICPYPESRLDTQRCIQSPLTLLKN